jgi:hypothetical protein
MGEIGHCTTHFPFPQLMKLSEQNPHVLNKSKRQHLSSCHISYNPIYPPLLKHTRHHAVLRLGPSILLFLV